MRSGVGDDNGQVRASLGVSGGLVGREDELATVIDSLAVGTSVLVVGGAGIGKTALVRATASLTEQRLRSGAATDFLQGVPWLALRRALGTAPPSADPESVADWAADASRSDLLVLDDLQWGDADSLDTLVPLAARRPIIATCRPTGLAAGRTRQICDAAGFRIVELGPLTPDHMRDLLDDLPDPVDDAARDRIVEKAGGNPLFARLLAAGRGGLDATGYEFVVAAVEDCPPDAGQRLTEWGLGGPPASPDAPGVAGLLSRGLAVHTDEGVVVVADLVAEVAAERAGPDTRREVHIGLARSATDPTVAAVH